MRLAFFCCAVLLVAGCGSRPSARGQDHEAVVKARLNNYSNCMFDAAEQFVSSASTAYEIADAAQGQCDRFFMSYQRGVEDYYRDTMPRSYSAKQTLSDAASRARETRRRVQRLVIQTVVEARAAK